MKIFFLVTISVIILNQMVLAQDNSKKGFAIYLLPDNIKSNKLATLDLRKLKPFGKPFIAQNEIISYQKETHGFQIDYLASDRLKKLQIPVSGKPFAVFIGDKAIYTGAFWTSISSQSFDGVIINKQKAIGNPPYYSNTDYPILTLETGYPTSEKFKGNDPRSDERILKNLEQNELLYEYFETVGKCQKLIGTGKRHASYVFTFSLDSTVNGNFPEKLYTFEQFADFGGTKMLSLLEANKGLKIGENPVSAFDSNKKILLKLSIQVKSSEPKIYLEDFWVK
jgi:hypothetical protein